MNDDPKELLGRAFGEEPPLRIDRDEVIRQGRKRLRRRRFIEAGGVVAAVLVAAVGAAMLTNLSGSDHERMPPAASRTEPPPRPSTISPTTPVPTISEPGAEVPPSVPGALDETRLLKLLYRTGIVTESDVAATLGTSGNPVFEPVGDQYVYQADIVRPKTPGSLSVTVDLAPGAVPDCDQVPPSYGDCGFTTRAGASILLARYENRTGHRGTYAAAVLDNGIRVVATTTNQTSYDAKQNPAGRAPALTEDELCDLVARVGSGAG